MKVLNRSLKTIFFILCTALSFHTIYGQKENKATLVKNLIESKHYAFKAQTMVPARGNIRNLTSEYDLKVLGDSVMVYLPYFGRAYAPVDPEQGPIQFNSTDLTYSVKKGKKGGWDVTIIPKDAKNVRQMFLSISVNGSASLNVTSNNRDPINFNGQIEPLNR